MTQLTEIHVSQILPASAYQLIGTNSAATKDIYLSLVGTTDQVIVTNSGTSITLSTPQNIDSTASPTFAGITLTGTITATNQTLTIKNIEVTTVSSDPVSPVEGQIWYRNDTHQWIGFNGSANVIIG
jgi:hypothetical protein